MDRIYFNVNPYSIHCLVKFVKVCHTPAVEPGPVYRIVMKRHQLLLLIIFFFKLYNQPSKEVTSGKKRESLVLRKKNQKFCVKTFFCIEISK